MCVRLIVLCIFLLSTPPHAQTQPYKDTPTTESFSIFFTPIAKVVPNPVIDEIDKGFAFSGIRNHTFSGAPRRYAGSLVSFIS